jgi:hypothetical protein
VVTGGLVDYYSAAQTFTLPPEHAVCLTGDGSLNLAPFSKATTVLAGHVEASTRVFRDGGGITYERFRPEFTELMDGLSRGLFDGQLAEGIIPLTGLGTTLTHGLRVADIRCGTGTARTSGLAHTRRRASSATTSGSTPSSTPAAKRPSTACPT